MGAVASTAPPSATAVMPEPSGGRENDHLSWQAEMITGRFVLHGHILNHEEIGMMQLIEVYTASP